MANQGLIIFGIITCCIIGILSIIMIILWVHGIYTLKCKSHKETHHFLYYVTLLTVLAYSFNVLLTVILTVFYVLSLLYDNINKSTILAYGFPVFGIWVFGVYMMFALFVFRLDVTFRNTYFRYKRRTIKILWIIYAALIVFIPLNTLIYVLELYIIFFILGFIGTVTFISFAIALFRMFVRKLKQIGNAKDQQGTQYIKNLVVKLNIIVVLSIISTCMTFALGTVAGLFTPTHPDASYFISHLLFAFDSSMFL